MKVYVVPTITHAYLKSLYSCIIKNENFEIFEFRKRFSTLRYLLKSDIVHLHWIESLFIAYDRKNTFFLTVIITAIYINVLITLKFILRKKLVITLHNIVPHRRLYPSLEHRIFKFSLDLADNVIVHNNYSKKLAIQTYDLESNKLSIIPHGHFFSNYPNTLSKNESRNVLGIPNNYFVFLFLGSLNYYKGIPELLEVFSNVLKENEKIFLIITGLCLDNDLIETLKKFSDKFKTNSLIKICYVADEEIQVFMNASDVGVLPFRTITTSGSLLLYMSFKKPVIVPDLEPIQELLGDSGIYYKNSDNEDLMREILKTKNGFYDLKSISVKLNNLAEDYSWDDIAEETIKIYERIIQ